MQNIGITIVLTKSLSFI